MSTPSTTIETIRQVEETTATTSAQGTTVLKETTTTITQVEASKVNLKSDGTADITGTVATQTIVDESEEFYEEIDEEEDHGDGEDFAEDAPDDGRGENEIKIKGVIVDSKGRPVKPREK
ncbi:hypothetical protein NMY22_g1004 [Coprinellus aureogranulatus]|nr:hypothetical protein NMY22_g1004 [Coprinellus aureogranulatus]